MDLMGKTSKFPIFTYPVIQFEVFRCYSDCEWEIELLQKNKGHPVNHYNTIGSTIQLKCWILQWVCLAGDSCGYNISQLGWWFQIYGKIKVMFQTTNQISSARSTKAITQRFTRSYPIHNPWNVSMWKALQCSNPWKPWDFPIDPSWPIVGGSTWQAYTAGPKLGSETKFGTWVTSCWSAGFKVVPRFFSYCKLMNITSIRMVYGWYIMIYLYYTCMVYRQLLRVFKSTYWVVKSPLLMVPSLRFKYLCFLVIFTTAWRIQPWRYSTGVTIQVFQTGNMNSWNKLIEVMVNPIFGLKRSNKFFIADLKSALVLLLNIQSIDSVRWLITQVAGGRLCPFDLWSLMG